MPTLQENLDLAQSLMKELKSTTTCSNDIVPRSELPFLRQSEFPSYIEKHGQEKMSQVFEYTDKANAIRKVIDRIVKAKQRDFPVSPIMTQALATVAFGVGEAHELCAKITADLVDNSRFDILHITFDGMPNARYLGRVNHSHQIVLLGITDHSTLYDLTCLKNLPNNIVVIDPLLSFVGPAKDYVESNKAYLDTYQLNKFINFNGYNKKMLPAHRQIKSQATRLIERLKNAGVTPYIPVEVNKENELVNTKISITESMSTALNLMIWSVDSKEPLIERKIFDISTHQKAYNASNAIQIQTPKRRGVLIEERSVSSAQITDFFKNDHPLDQEEYRSFDYQIK